jgi:hypothetical protein
MLIDPEVKLIAVPQDQATFWYMHNMKLQNFDHSYKQVQTSRQHKVENMLKNKDTACLIGSTMYKAL